MIGKIASLFTVGLILSGVTAVAADSEKEGAAFLAAEKWLSIVDRSAYGESWKEAAQLFRTAISPQQWEQSVQAARGPFGRVLSRRVKSKTSATSLSGAPDGEYVVIQFDTSFEHKKKAVETVTPMMEKDGKWRVSGYYIK
ncbi:MAG: DUF4019 domain-containing protein [Thermodesulfobacteriota bacterium]|nr:DUF4019 domain-containing protein [Thermodesulfobacteriota bacterium]